jgi:hypothetical protein
MVSCGAAPSAVGAAPGLDPVSAAELADITLADKQIEDAGVNATFVGRFLVRLDQMALRGHVERIKDGQSVRWKLAQGAPNPYNPLSRGFVVWSSGGQPAGGALFWAKRHDRRRARRSE